MPEDSKQNLSSDEALTAEALERWKQANDAEQENRLLAVDDQKFLNGEHWPSNIKKDREDDKRPCLTINRFPSFLDQVVGDQRQNRPRIKVRPVDDDADPIVADILSGVIRNIEYQSKAEAIYDYSLEQSAGSGTSYFLLATQYANNDSFDQEAKIKRIKNSFSVYLDPDAQEIDKSDANWGFVIEDFSRAEFKRRYPDAEDEGQDWLKGVGEEYSDWFTLDKVRVADYYKKVYSKRTIVLLSDGTVIDKTEFETLSAKGVLDDGIDMPAPTVVKERVVEDVKVIHHKITGNTILEESKTWAGENVPIIAVLGKELNVQGRTIYRGLIRHAKDSAQMYNFWRTASTEVVALAPKSPWIATPEQVEGHEPAWKRANVKNISLLKYNHVHGVPMPQRTSPAAIPTGMVNEAQVSIEDQKAVIGIYDAGLGARSNETSGIAIRERKRESDVGTFAFVDNLSRALTNAGRQLVDVILKIYDTPRIVRIRGLDDSERFVMINQEIPLEGAEKYTYDGKAPKDGKAPFYDLGVGKYDVVVETGPSFSTQRVEASESMMAFVAAVPTAGELTADLIADAQDWPKRDEFVKRLRKALPPGVAEPEEGEEQEIQQPPTPEEMMAQQTQQAQAELETRKLDLEFEKLEVERMKIAADVNKVEAETEGKEGELEQKMRAIAIDAIAEAHGGIPK
jgi:hypothetical protein